MGTYNDIMKQGILNYIDKKASKSCSYFEQCIYSTYIQHAARCGHSARYTAGAKMILFRKLQLLGEKLKWRKNPKVLSLSSV